MAIDTLLAFIVAMDFWRWRPLYAAPLFGVFLSVDLAFFSANVPKVPQGGWFPLVLGITIFFIMWTWQKGRTVLRHRIQNMAMSLKTFLEDIGRLAPQRVSGTAVFLTARHLSMPVTLLQNFEHNKVVHERVVLLTVDIEDVPHIADSGRVQVERLEHGFYRVTARYGFMESPNVPKILRLCRGAGLDIELADTTFFLGRETLMPSDRPDLNPWQEKLFISMFRNASSPIAFFQLPVDRVLELGCVVEV